MVPIGWLTMVVWPGLLFADTMRYAVVVANNDGGGDREILRYAEDDARRMVRVLEDLGRFLPGQTRTLLGVGPEQALNAVGQLSDEIAAIPENIETLLLVYYSGHSDGHSLLMGSEKLGIFELKQALNRCDADVVLLILDACHAGAAIREKGGRSAPSFIHFGEKSKTKGRVILTSTSASEPSQESDEVGSSFFTHYLVSGMMGDADQSGDGRVTLTELYGYAYDRTVHRTMDTMPGVQHPGFSYDLKGEGSIVMTDLNTGQSGILLPYASAGTYLLYDRKRKTVVAELQKTAGEERLVPLSPGAYTLKKRLDDYLLVVDVKIERDHLLEIGDAKMRKEAYEDVNAKGWGLDLRNTLADVELGPWLNWTVFAKSPAGGIWSYPAGGVALSYRGWPDRKWAVRAAVSLGGWNESGIHVQNERIPYRLLQVGADLSLGRRFFYGPLVAELGARANLCFLQRRFSLEGDIQTTDETFGVGAGPHAAASIRIGAVRISLDLTSGLMVFPTAENNFIPYLAAGLVMGLGMD